MKMVRQSGRVALVLLLIAIGLMGQSKPTQEPAPTYWVGTSDDGSPFVLELYPSGKLRFIPTTGIVSKGIWKASGKAIEMELNSKYVRLTGTIETDQMQGIAISKLARHWTWTAAKQPQVIATAVPQYPPLARTARVSGNVLVDVEIDSRGAVISIHSVKGHPLLRKAAEEAARKYKFQPVTEASARVARLVFIFTWLDVPEERERIISPLILSPYQIEVRRGYSTIQRERSYSVGKR